MWTAVCSQEFYKKYMKQHEERFSGLTNEEISLRQSSLKEYAQT